MAIAFGSAVYKGRVGEEKNLGAKRGLYGAEKSDPERTEKPEPEHRHAGLLLSLLGRRITASL